MSDCTLSGNEVIRGEVKEPYSGAWVAEMRLDADAKPTGSVSLVLLGSTWKGSVIADPVDAMLTLSGVDGGYFTARVVGGAGGLGKQVQPQEWAQGAAVQQVLSYILQAGGESQATDIDPQILGTALSQWSITTGTVGGALAALVEYLAVSKPGLVWRIRRDGLVWIGAPSPVQVPPPDYIVTAPGPEAGQAIWDLNEVTVGPDQIIDGLTIRQVIYQWDAAQLRALVTFAPGPVNVLWQLFAQWQRRIGLDYYRQLSGRIAAQNDATSVQFQPDMNNYSGMRKVGLRYGLPDVTVEQATGRGSAAWDGATPAAPVIDSYAPSTAAVGTGGSSAQTITIGVSAPLGAQAMIRGGDYRNAQQTLDSDMRTNFIVTAVALAAAGGDASFATAFPAAAAQLVAAAQGLGALTGAAKNLADFEAAAALANNFLTQILRGG